MCTLWLDLLIRHTHHTLAQPGTLSLINNTLDCQLNLKTNIMDVHCILIKIVNGKQARSASSMLTRIEDNTDYARTGTDIIFTCIL